jgi:predicted 3-demethylubiquinone-9 3-methyltransferase (glyoxalase superfamily)
MKYELNILITILALLALSCSTIKQSGKTNEEVRRLQAGLDSVNGLEPVNSDNMKGQIITFLTFQKEDAEEAMNFYVRLFENSRIDNINRWGSEGPGKEGTIMSATFTLNSKPFMCSDSPAIHDWDFTPAVSNYIDCHDENELERLFTSLSEDGKIMMPLNNYGFSQRFGFVEDKFGVSWQLNFQ